MTSVGRTSPSSASRSTRTRSFESWQIGSTTAPVRRSNSRAAALHRSQVARGCDPVLLRDLLPIVQESLQADVGQGVLGHLLEHVEGERDDVRAELRGLDHVDGMSDARHQDLPVPVVVPENPGDLPDALHALLADVVEPSDERAHVLRPRLRREDRLVRGENERRVDLDAFGRESLDRLEALRRHLNLHDDILVELRELAALLDHLVRLGRRDLEGDRPVDEGEDVLDHLGPLPARLCDERGVRRHAVQDAPRGRLADLIDVRRVEEDLHHDGPPASDSDVGLCTFTVPRRALLRASKDYLIEGKRTRPAFVAPGEDDRIGIAKASPRGPVNSPGLVEEGWGRTEDLDLSLGPTPVARIGGRAESPPILDQGNRLRVNLVRYQDGVRGYGAFPSISMEHVGLREERIEETRVGDLHLVTRTGSDRDADSPSDPRPRRWGGLSGPSRGRVGASVQSGQHLLRPPRPIPDPPCERGGPIHCPTDEPSPACIYIMYTRPTLNPFAGKRE